MDGFWLGAISKKRIRLSSLWTALTAVLLICVGLFAYLFLTGKPLPIVRIPQFRSSLPTFMGNIESFAGTTLNHPTAVAAGEDGKVYVADSGNARILVYDRDGQPLLQFGRFGSKDGELDYPYAVAVSPDNRVYVGQFQAPKIQIFDDKGKFLGKIDSSTVGQVVAPLALAVDKTGNLFAANRNGKVLVFNPKGQLVRIFADGYLAYPRGIAVTDNEVFISDTNHKRILVFTKAGQFMKAIDQAQLKTEMPSGIAIDFADEILSVDTFGNKVNTLDQNFNYLFSFGKRGNGEGELNFPVGITIDPFGRIYVVDTVNNRVAIFEL